MRKTVYGWADVLTTWPGFSLLVVACLLCVIGFSWRTEALGPCNVVLDARGWYTPTEAYTLLDDLGAGGRHLYAVTQVTLDLVFPFVYATLFAVLLVRVYTPATAGRLVFLPLLAAVLDIVENGLIAYLAWSFNPGDEQPAIAGAAAVATAAKTLFLALTILAIAIGGVWALPAAARELQTTAK